jgi:hypothetical protein
MGRKMRARRTWKVVGAQDHHASIDQLQLDLAAFNRSIEVLEKANANPRDIELLAAHALTLAERIDEMRWLNPVEALGWLFEQATPQRSLKKRRTQAGKLLSQQSASTDLGE